MLIMILIPILMKKALSIRKVQFMTLQLNLAMMNWEA